MAFQTGIATDYLDMLDQLVAFATERNVVSASLVDGGTLYTAGDILTAAGGTFASPALIEVLTVDGGGVILTFRLVENGTYSVDPSNPDNPTDGTGSGAQFDYVMDDTGWTELRDSAIAESATIDTAGTLYFVNEILTVVGGTFIEPAKFKVLTVGVGGTLSTVELYQAGEYTIQPSNPVDVTGALGSGGKLDVTFSGEKNILLQGVGSGLDEVFAGIRTFADAGAHNWEIAGMTGYQAASLWSDQPGISPGRHDLSEMGSYVPLNNSSLNYWLWATGRRIIGVFKMGSTYTNMYLGFTNPFGTPEEYPYPFLTMGCSSLRNRVFSTSTIGFSGMVDPIGHQTATTAGPGSVRDPGGSWKQTMNSEFTGSGRTQKQDLVVFPAGTPHHSGVSASDLGSNGVWPFTKIIPADGLPGTQVVNLYPTPDSPEYVSPLVPAVLIEASPVRQVLGEMDSVYWVNAQGQSTDLVSEDEITIGDDVYLVFQNCNRTDIWAHFAIKRG